MYFIGQLYGYLHALDTNTLVSAESLGLPERDSSEGVYAFRLSPKVLSATH